MISQLHFKFNMSEEQLKSMFIIPHRSLKRILSWNIHDREKHSLDVSRKMTQLKSIEKARGVIATEIEGRHGVITSKSLQAKLG